MYCTPNELKVSFRPGRFRLWMSLFTVVLFVHELKGKQASPAPQSPSLPLADHQVARPAGCQPGRWLGGRVGVFVTQQLRTSECETTANPSST